MSVAGPSRRAYPSGGAATRERVESTYEQDLLALLGQLGLDEMDEMETFFTHRTGAGEQSSDHDVAMNDFLEQAHALAAFNQDRLLAERIAAGEDEFGLEFQRPPIVEAPRVAVPRVVAPRVAVPQPIGRGMLIQQNQHRQPARNGTVPSQTWGGWFASVVDWAFAPASQSGAANTAKTAIRVPVVNNRPTGHDCVICQDPIHGVEIRAPCGHYYDVGCTTDLFRSATRDETLYPPRCCRQNIPFAQVRPHISQVLITAFLEKEAEFGTTKRVYCSSPACSRFLGPLSEGIFASKVYTCPAQNCGRRTCGKCREHYTGDWSHVCRPDADAAQVLELGRASGWARCPGCSQMIELNVGCFHMTCRCRTEFCYLCRARWKTCQCPQWDERRLVAAAEERVDAQLGGRERAVRRDVPVQQARPAPAPVPAPAFVPARNPYAPVAIPVPGPARRPAPAVPAAAGARPVALARPVAQTPALRPQPTPTRTTPTASSSTVRLPYTTPAPTTTRTPTNPFMSPSVFASTQSPSAPTSASATASTSASAASSSSPGPRWPKAALGSTDPARQRLVREMMERLRVDHECDHKQWRYRNGEGSCQHCGHYLPLYLFRCQGCEMLACNRCRRNRL